METGLRRSSDGDVTTHSHTQPNTDGGTHLQLRAVTHSQTQPKTDGGTEREKTEGGTEDEDAHSKVNGVSGTTDMKTDVKDGLKVDFKLDGKTEPIIRKRSVKKRVSRDESHNKPVAERKYGHDSEEYHKLAERVMGERATVTALEVLQERWRMISFMYDDCLDMVKQWDAERLTKQHQRHKRRLLFFSVLSLPLLLAVLAWLVARWWW